MLIWELPTVHSILGTSLMESIFARQFFIFIIRIQLVCKEWKSIICSPTFKNALYEVKNRKPWFLMVDSEYNINSVYDMEVGDWHQLRLQIPTDSFSKQLSPIVSSGGYMCFISYIGTLVVINPLSGSKYEIPHFQANKYVEAISMVCRRDTFEIFVVYKDSSNLRVTTYSSMELQWKSLQLQVQEMDDEEEFGYNIGTSGEWSQWRTKFGLTTIDNEGHAIVYYMNERAEILKCDVKHRIAYKYSRLGIQHDEDYDFDMVECGGRIFIVVLKYCDINDTSDDEYSIDSDDEEIIEERNVEELDDNIFKNDVALRCKELEDVNTINEDLLENERMIDSDSSSDGYQMGAAIEIYEFDNDIQKWVNIAEIPPNMTEEYSGVKADIYCSGYGGDIVICVSSKEWNIYDVIKYNLIGRVWEKLPPCNDRDTGVSKRFVCAYSIMPQLF